MNCQSDVRSKRWFGWLVGFEALSFPPNVVADDDVAHCKSRNGDPIIKDDTADAE